MRIRHDGVGMLFVGTALATALTSVVCATPASADAPCVWPLNVPGQGGQCTLGDLGSGPTGPYVRLDFRERRREDGDDPGETVVQLTMCPADISDDDCLNWRGEKACHVETYDGERSEDFYGGSSIIRFHQAKVSVRVDCDPYAYDQITFWR